MSWIHRILAWDEAWARRHAFPPGPIFLVTLPIFLVGFMGWMLWLTHP